MDDTNERETADPPKEGSNRGNGPEGQRRANISETISTGASEASDGVGDELDNNPTPAEKDVPDDKELGVEDVALEDADDPDPGASRGAADEQATKAERSI